MMRMPGTQRIVVIDVAVINPKKNIHKDALNELGPGGAATLYEAVKRFKYRELNLDIYEFVPFIMTTEGAFGETAMKFMKRLEKIMRTK